MRLFVAGPLTDDVRHRLAHLLVEAVPHGLPGRPVRPENWHLTLRFLGEVGEVEADRLMAALDLASLGRPFQVGWSGLGAFPRPSRATVLWVGMDRGADQAVALAEAVEAAVVSSGLEPADRPFRAHLTVSRIRPHQDVTPIVESVSLQVTMPVDRVVLYRSHLDRGGARYEEIGSFPLG
jgi:2'-5' RNA ligase